jgi:hypothetical protein
MGSIPSRPSKILKVRLSYVTAGSVRQVVDLYCKVLDTIPVDWNNKTSIKQFKNASDLYSKQWSRLNYEGQGLVCEIITTKLMDR